MMGDGAVPADDDLLSRWLDSVEDDDGTIPPVDRSSILPASHSQRGMWMAQQIGGDRSTAFVVRHAYRVRGALDVAALSGALSDLVARHEPLRTAFHLVGDDLHQRVCEPYLVSLNALQRFDSDAEVQQAIASFLSTPMDLEQGQLLRAGLFRRAQDEHVLLLVVHHIANDAWSMTIFHDEISELYDAYISGRKPRLSDLEVQYVDFVQWQLAQQSPDATSAAVDFWRGYLAGAPEALQLPTDRPRPPIRSMQGGWLEFQVADAVMRRMDALTKELSATRFLLALTAFQLTLARWSGSDDFLIGSSVSVRPTPGTERMVGPFTNLLPVRSRVNWGESFRGVFERTKSSVLAARDHDSLSFEQLISLVGAKHSPAYSPLVQVSMTSHDGLVSPLKLTELDVSALPTQDVDVQRDLSLWITGSHGECGLVGYAADLFEPQTIQRFVDDYLRVLAHVTRYPDATVSDIELMGPPTELGHGTPVRTEHASQREDAALTAVVCETVQEVLRTPVTGSDDFFALGGESLTAMRVCTRLGRRLGVRIPVRTVYEHPRLGDLSVAVQEEVERRRLSRPLASGTPGPAHAFSSANPLRPGDIAAPPTGRSRVAPEETETSLHRLFEDQVRRDPRRVAVTYAGTSATYADLEAHANQLARYLVHMGITPGDHVGVCLGHGDKLVAVLLAILKAGASIVPLEPALPAARLRTIVKDAGIRDIVIDLDSRSADLNARTIESDVAFEAAKSYETTPLNLQTSPEDIAYVIYTSGSTGAPKGVAVPHRGACNRLIWQGRQVGLGSGDVALFKTSISFDVFIGEVFLPLAFGAELVVASNATHRDAGALLDLVDRHRVTFAHFVPSLLDVILEEPDLGRRAASLTSIWCGGESLTSRQYRALRGATSATIYHGYGPTETSIGAMFRAYGPDEDDPVMTIGRPIANTSVHLLDEHGVPVRLGSTGELAIGGLGLAAGYVGDAGLTARRFVPNVFDAEPGRRLYRTGDLVRLRADGEYEFLGRTDNQLKVGGRRLEPEGIETTLMRHPQVATAVVVPARTANKAIRLIAYCVPAAGQSASTTDLIEWLRKLLPDHEIPRKYIFVSALPLTLAGKVDRQALADRVAKDESQSALVSEGGSLPRVLATFQDVVGLPMEDSDDFFESGGNSVAAAKVCSRLSITFGFRVSVRELFDHRTAVALSEAIDQRVGAEERSPLVASESDRSAPMFDVLVNGEGQYGLHPAALPIPGGWTSTGVSGTEAHCVEWVDNHWTDMRPLSLRVERGAQW